jgi:hypothetical protein
MKKVFLIIFGICIISACHKKNNSENALEKVLFSFENHLIKQHVLEDNKGISYVKLLKEIVLKNDVNYQYNYSFIDTLENTKNIDITRYLKLQKKLTFNKAIAYENLMASNTKEMDLHPALVAKKILSITKATDFESNYFKLRFLLFFDLANINP